MDKTKTGGVLLLSCGTGEGHNSAAKAIAQALAQRGVACRIADPLALDGARAGARAAAVYNGMIRRSPAAFSLLYRAGRVYSSARLPSPVYAACARFAGPLQAYVDAGGFDAVVCTHLFALEAMTAARERYGCRVPCFGVLTDYSCIPFFAETRVDGYFIPHDDIAPQLCARGIPETRIFSTGIPVSPRFAEPLPQAQARRALGLDEDGPLLLVMSGGAGCGAVRRICGELARRGARACVLTGHNAALRAGLEAKYAAAGIRAIGFTDRVRQYMAAADALITKPGGLTSTEAAVAGVPLVQLEVYAACDAANAAFFAERGLSVRARTPHEAVGAALALAADRQAAQHMRAQQRRHIHPYAADAIARQVTGL